MDLQTCEEYPGRPKDQTAALEQFIQSRVTDEMIYYLAYKAHEVIKTDSSPSLYANHKFSTTPPSPQFLTEDDLKIPSLEEFIAHIVKVSNVGAGTLMTTLVYLERLRQRLPPIAKGLKCTTHRIVLACLIITAKFTNDSSPKNRHWSGYTRLESTCLQDFSEFGFSRTEVNLMEAQLLRLLDFDLNFGLQELEIELEDFLYPIRKSFSDRRKMRRAAQKMADRKVACQIERSQAYGSVAVSTYNSAQHYKMYAHGRVPSVSDVPDLTCEGYEHLSPYNSAANSANISRETSRSRSATPASSVSSTMSYEDFQVNLSAGIDYTDYANGYTDGYSPAQVYIAAPTHGKVQPVVDSHAGIKQTPTDSAPGMTRTTSSNLFSRLLNRTEQTKAGFMTLYVTAIHIGLTK